MGVMTMNLQLIVRLGCKFYVYKNARYKHLLRAWQSSLSARFAVFLILF